MSDSIIVAAGILGIALILAVAVHAIARLRVEQQRTLQKLIERGLDADAIVAAAAIPSRNQRELRRGAWLIAIGLAWSAATFFVGGKAWMLGIVPVMLGGVVLLLRKLDARAG